MRIALMQEESIPLDVEANLATLETSAARAKEAGADLILTPELFVTGYAPIMLAEWMTSETVDPLVSEVAEIARRVQIAIVASMPLRVANEENQYTIGSVFFDERGHELLRYSKVHLWARDEPAAFVPSDEAPATAEWKGRTVGMQICYDIEFPEPTRFLAEQGVDLLFVPTAIDADSTYVARTLVPARAAENSLVIAYCDHPRSVDQPFVGLSLIAGREGVLHADADYGRELLIGEIPNVEPVVEGAADYLKDRRQDVYATWRSAD